MSKHSSEKTQPGILYVCGTPIGNLKDASFRLIEVLGEVDLIVCEDTRRTSKLLNYYDIKKPLMSLHEHVERQRTEKVLHCLAEGQSVALVSDAGMPVISDPGAYLVSAARIQGFVVTAIPGPSAITTALAISGFYSPQFVFGGFPPRKSRKRIEFFAKWIQPQVPAVFFESPYRLLDSLKDLMEIFPKIQVSLCHEMTKIYESVIVGPVEEVHQELKDGEIKGEWVIVAYLRKENANGEKQ
ncbi:MAG TPA: 16S rRNA (cytidine(1402)-2'-O)-methyltransferase [Bacillota bacterium]|nr:16S rRNA (cytidine(1402)-2'-O)-methyltransferase [Candidatus Fermentithermobacillaceae bacterium]HOK64711.1 16S rRNA (cytidine(1402)-2'-O)-methyltransferase [Bacillota bacterium]HOL12278.1 16S rRNA (cytidine(1402)-2'-O)-methyltransferase [Bacillota bacterium]HOQ03340.1 16S rRNA (cytidine(1402)-2'-O)-methyltransferase [Bacillota bacterium]HPP61100.1 16S rRNA (cytidine(1402)-2'-O)-methyltransferase [Bacillota bacterium]